MVFGGKKTILSWKQRCSNENCENFKVSIRCETPCAFAPFIYAHAEIRTRVVVICDPTRYQLDHSVVEEVLLKYILMPE